MAKDTKYIFVTGGVLSSLGKGKCGSGNDESLSAWRGVCDR
jgi:CTP synthase (UTP-ammonia lyase)